MTTAAIICFIAIHALVVWRLERHRQLAQIAPHHRRKIRLYDPIADR